MCTATIKPHTSLQREDVSEWNGTEAKMREANNYFLSNGEEAWKESASAIKGKSDSINLFIVLLTNPVKRSSWKMRSTWKHDHLVHLDSCHLTWPPIIWPVVLLAFLLINQCENPTCKRKTNEINSFNLKTLVTKKKVGLECSFPFRECNDFRPVV